MKTNISGHKKIGTDNTRNKISIINLEKILTTIKKIVNLKRSTIYSYSIK